MALQYSTTTEAGFDVSEAYAKIFSFQGNKNSVFVTIQTYKNAAARNSGKEPFLVTSIMLEIPDGATMEQMYTALKLHEPFLNAIDC